MNAQRRTRRRPSFGGSITRLSTGAVGPGTLFPGTSGRLALSVGPYTVRRSHPMNKSEDALLIVENDGQDAETLLRQADVRMYAAKHGTYRGRGARHKEIELAASA